MRILKTREASKALGYTPRHVQRLVAEKKLKPINPYHKKGFMFDSEEIRRFLQDKEGSSTTSAQRQPQECNNVPTT